MIFRENKRELIFCIQKQYYVEKHKIWIIFTLYCIVSYFIVDHDLKKKNLKSLYILLYIYNTGKKEMGRISCSKAPSLPCPGKAEGIYYA